MLERDYYENADTFEIVHILKMRLKTFKTALIELKKVRGIQMCRKEECC